MHILLIHQSFTSLDEPGGTRHYELARLLAARGHRITVIASPVSYLTGGRMQALGESHGEGENRNITVLRASTYSALHRSFLHRLISFFSFMISSFFIGLGVKNVDVVWGTSPPIFQGVTAWSLARLKGARFLFEVRDLWPKFAIAVGVLKSRLLISLSLWLERFLYLHADRVVVNSPGFVSHVRERGARKVDLIPNGSDPDMFDPANTGKNFRRQYHLEGKFVVLYAGAHGISNDLGVVLDAASRLVGDPRVMVVLIGDGKEKTNLVAQAESHHLDNVIFLPPCPKQDMPDALAGADVCLAILKPLEEYKTTYPNKVFDYMAAARPVLLAVDGVIRELVEQAGCGVFVPPGDAAALAAGILKMVDVPVENRLMGMAGRKYLEENYSRGRIAEKLLQVLEDMVRERKDLRPE